MFLACHGPACTITPLDTIMRTALLLEDEPLIAMDLEFNLQDAGFDVVHLMSCADADRWIDGHSPDVAIVDVELRDGSCHAVVGRLRNAGVPFIVHSGSHPSEHTGTNFEHGSWLMKPSSMRDMISAVRQAIGTV